MYAFTERQSYVRFLKTMHFFHITLVAIFVSIVAADEVTELPTCLFCIPGTVEEWKPSCTACLGADVTSLEVCFPATS